MRVVLDTDVVVAGLRSRHGASRLWLRAVRRREVELLISVPLAIQYESVLLRPEIIASVRLTAQQIGQVLDLLCTIGRQVAFRSSGARCCATRATRWCWIPP